MALWPIVLVIIAAVFTYNLCVRTGAMDVIGSMITSISSDRRLLALLVAWCFGGFMELSLIHIWSARPRPLRVRVQSDGPPPSRWQGPGPRPG